MPAKAQAPSGTPSPMPSLVEGPGRGTAVLDEGLIEDEVVDVGVGAEEVADGVAEIVAVLLAAP